MPKSNKEYVQMAKAAVRGKLAGASLKYLLASLVISAVFIGIVFAAALPMLEQIHRFTQTPVKQIPPQLLTSFFTCFIAIFAAAIVTEPISYLGLSRFSLRMLQDETPRFADYVCGLRHPLRTIGNILLFLLRICIPFVLGMVIIISCMTIFSVFGSPSLSVVIMLPLMFGTGILVFAVSLKYTFIQLEQLLHPKMKIREWHSRSRAIMKGNRWRLVKLNLRLWYLYLPVILLSVLTELPAMQKPDMQFILIAATLLLLVYSLPMSLFFYTLNFAFGLDMDVQLDPSADMSESLEEANDPQPEDN